MKSAAYLSRRTANLRLTTKLSPSVKLTHICCRTVIKTLFSTQSTEINLVYVENLCYVATLHFLRFNYLNLSCDSTLLVL